MFDFSDKIVVITGAAGNLGRAATIAFHNAGAKVAVVDRRRKDMRDVFKDIIPEDNYCYYVKANLLDENSVAQMIDEIIDHYGRIDVLVNIAGGFTMGDPVHRTDLKTWDFMLNLNARSVFFVCKYAIPHMLEEGSGKIISIAARAGLKGKAKMAPYIISKSAVIRLTESMSDEVKEHNINVNCILPGTIDTKRNREDNPDADYSQWVQPEALADAMLILASPASRAIHGAAIPVYGTG